MPTPTNVLLLISPGCPHCASVMQHLQTLIKDATIGELKIINIAARPDVATKLNARSVPWIKLGPFELVGSHSLDDLKTWIDKIESPTGMADYFADLFHQGQREKIQNMVLAQDTLSTHLFLLAADINRGMDIRIGVGAIMEELADRGRLKNKLKFIIELTRNPDPTIRADGAHYLALSRSDQSIEQLQNLLNDENAMVREVAKDALEELTENKVLH